MSRMAATAAILAFAPAPAFAGDIQCLWRQLAPEARTGFLAAHDQGAAALSTLADRFGLDALSDACVAPGPGENTRRAAVGRAFSAYVAERNAAAALEQGAAGLPPAALDAAWNGLEPAQRHILVDQVGQAQMTAAVTDALRAAVLGAWTAAARSGEPDGPTMLLMVDHFLSRALRVRSERAF